MVGDSNIQTSAEDFLGAMARMALLPSKTPGRIQEVEPPSPGFQYSYGVDYRTLVRGTYLLDPLRGLGYP